MKTNYRPIALVVALGVLVAGCTEQPPNDPALDPIPLPPAPKVEAPVPIAPGTGGNVYVPAKQKVVLTGNAKQDAMKKLQVGQAFFYSYERLPTTGSPGLAAKGRTNGEQFDITERQSPSAAEQHYLGTAQRTVILNGAQVNNVPDGAPSFLRLRELIGKVESTAAFREKDDFVGKKVATKYQFKLPDMTCNYWIDEAQSELLQVQAVSSAFGTETITFSEFGKIVAIQPIPGGRRPRF
jgi:hypothetical protein